MSRNAGEYIQYTIDFVGAHSTWAAGKISRYQRQNRDKSI